MRLHSISALFCPLLAVGLLTACGGGSGGSGVLPSPGGGPVLTNQRQAPEPAPASPEHTPEDAATQRRTEEGPPRVSVETPARQRPENLPLVEWTRPPQESWWLCWNGEKQTYLKDCPEHHRDAEGYTTDEPVGYDRNGYDRNGWNRRNTHRETNRYIGPDGWDRWGYDKNGRDRQGYDRQGRGRDGSRGSMVQVACWDSLLRMGRNCPAPPPGFSAQNFRTLEYRVANILKDIRAAEAYAALGTPDGPHVSPSGAGVIIGFDEPGVSPHPETEGKLVAELSNAPRDHSHGTTTTSIALAKRGAGISYRIDPTHAGHLGLPWFAPSPDGMHGVAPGARFAWRNGGLSKLFAAVPIINRSRATSQQWDRIASGQRRDAEPASWIAHDEYGRSGTDLVTRQAGSHHTVLVNGGGNHPSGLGGPANPSVSKHMLENLYRQAGRGEDYDELSARLRDVAARSAAAWDPALPTLLVAVAVNSAFTHSHEFYVGGRAATYTTTCGVTQDYCLAAPSGNSVFAWSASSGLPAGLGGQTSLDHGNFATSLSAPVVAGALAVLAEKFNGASCMSRWPDVDGCLQVEMPALARRLLDTANRGTKVRAANRNALDGFKATLGQVMFDTGAGRAALQAEYDRLNTLPPDDRGSNIGFYEFVVAPLELTPFYRARYDALKAGGMTCAEDPCDAILEELALSVLVGAGVMDLGAAAQPQGELRVASGAQVSGSSERLSASRVRLSAAFGDALPRGLEDMRFAAFDSQGFPFLQNAGASLVSVEPPDPLARLALLARPDTQGSAPSPPPAFGLRQTAERHEGLFAAQAKGPFLSFAPSVASVDAGGLLFGADLRLGLAAGPETDGQRPWAAVMERELSGPVTWRWRAGALREPASLWGLSGEGAFVSGPGTTAFTGLAMETDLGGGLRLEADVALGAGRQGDSSGAIAVPGLAWATAFSTSLSHPDTLADGDTLALRVSQPLRAEGGRAQVRLPVARTWDGRVVRRTAQVDLAPSGREVSVDLAWQGEAAGGSLALVAGAVLEPGHVAAAGPAPRLLVRQNWDW